MKTSSGERVRQLRTLKGWTQQRLADEIGRIKRVTISRSAIAQWENGDSQSLAADNLYAAARALGTSMEALLGETPLSNVVPTSTIRGEAPVLAWEHLHNIMAAIEEARRSSWGGEMVQTARLITPLTFALRVLGDSMEPDFPPGSHVIVDPELIAGDQDYVVTTHPGGATSLRQLVRDGPDLLLKPSNPRYPMRPLGQDKVVGVVVEMVRSFR